MNRKPIRHKLVSLLLASLLLLSLTGAGLAAIENEVPTRDSGIEETTSQEAAGSVDDTLTVLNAAGNAAAPQVSGEPSPQEPPQQEPPQQEPPQQESPPEPDEGTVAGTNGGGIEADGDGAAEEGTTAPKVTFMVGEDIYATLPLNENGLVDEPEAPGLPEGMRSFLGWFDEDGKLFSFATVVEEDLILYAQFSTKFLVRFMDGGLVVESVEVEYGSKVQLTSYQPAPPEGHRFMYWYVLGTDPSQPYNFDAPVEDNLLLVPHFSEMYYVYFISGGNTVQPLVVTGGEAAQRPANPSRDGYTFKHWSTEPEGPAYSFATPVTSDLLLYGVWTPKNVNYTVVYWLEMPNVPAEFVPSNPDYYNYAFSEQRTAVAGTEKSISSGEATKNNAALNYAEYGHSSTTTILGNGTSVVNVYFVRKIYTITFDLNAGSYNATMKVGDKTYTKNGEKYTITAKYEQDISDVWPVLEYDEGGNPSISYSRNNYDFYGWKPQSNRGVDSNSTWVSKRVTMTKEMMPSSSYNGYTVNAQWSNSARLYYARYMLESVDGTGDLRYSNVWYNQDELSQYLLRTNTGLLGLKGIEGFTANVATWVNKDATTPQPGTSNRYTDNRGAYHMYLFYTRNSYALSFNSMGGSAITGNSAVKYEMPLSTYEPTPPTRTGFDFKGWYLDADYKEKADFATLTMPARPLQLFAKWESDEFTVTFFDNVGGNPLGSNGVAKDGNVPYPDYYQVGKGYEDLGIFKGWYWYAVPGLLTTFAFETPIQANTSIYAQWTTEGFTVTYDKAGGEGTAPVDNATYKLGVLAPVLGAQLTKDGGALIGWQVDGTGRTYYPGNTIAAYGHIKFVAKYALKDAVYHTITFLPNYEGATDSDIYTVEDGQTRVQFAGGNAFTREGYRIIGWAHKKDAALPDYAPGYLHEDPITESMVLYAVWEPTGQNVTFIAGEHGRFEGQDSPVTIANIKKGTSWADALTPPTPVADEGYYFAGWSDTFPAAVDKDYSFTANFEQQLEITVTAGSARRTYNSQPLTSSEFSLTAGALKGSDSLQVTTEGSQLDVGQSPNRVKTVAVLRGQTDVSAEYKIQTVDGTLVVDKAPAGTMTVSAPDAGDVYNGAAYTVTASSNITGATILYRDAQGNYTLDECPPYINAGEYTVEFIAEHRNYERAEGKATITITKRPATITVDSKTKEFGQNDPAFTGEVTNLVSQNDLGTVQYGRAEADKDKQNAGADITLTATYTSNSNYTVSVVEGKLTITPASTGLTVRADDISRRYDANAYGVTATASVEDATIRYRGPDGQYSLETSPVYTEVGEYTVYFEASHPDYKSVPGQAKVIITQRPVTITVAPATKHYGEADPAFTGVIDGLMYANDLAPVAYVRAPGYEDKHDAGEKIFLTATYRENRNYAVTVEMAALTILPAAAGRMTVSAAEVDVVYDGLPHSISGVRCNVADAEIRYMDSDGEYTLENPPSYTDAGSYTIYFRARHNNYTEATGQAEVLIRQKAVTIQADNKEKFFGTPDPEFTGSVTGLVDEADLGKVDFVRAENDRDKEDVGDGIAITATYTPNGNYIVNVKEGTLRIHKAPEGKMLVSAPEVNHIYNGTPVFVEPVCSEEGATILYMDEDGKYTLESSPQFTNAGDYTVHFIARHKNFEDATGEAKVHIQTRAAVIHVQSEYKSYGEEDPEFTGQVTGLVDENDLGTVRFVRAANDMDKEDAGDSITLTAQYTPNSNYRVTINKGTLEIYPAESGMGVGADDVLTPYTGTAHSVAASSNLADADILYRDGAGDYTLEKSPQFTDVGEYTVYFVARHKNYYDVEAHAEVEITPASLTVEAIGLTLLEGDELPELRYTLQGLVAGENESVLNEAPVLETTYTKDSPVGRYPITVRRTLSAGNYTVAYIDAELVVERRETSSSSSDGGTSGSSSSSTPGGGDSSTPDGGSTPGGGGETPGPDGGSTTTSVPTSTSVVAASSSAVSSSSASGTGGASSSTLAGGGGGTESTNGGQGSDSDLTGLDDPEVPLASLQLGGWSILNLVLAVLSLLCAVVFAVRLLAARKQRDEQEAAKSGAAICRILGILVGIASPVVFLITQNLRLSPVFADKYTFLMVLFALVQVGAGLLLLRGRNKPEEALEEEE